MMNKTKSTSQQLTRLFLKLFIGILFLTNLAFIIISTGFIYQEANNQAQQVLENVSVNLHREDDDHHLKKKNWEPILNAYISKQEDNAIALTTPKNKEYLSGRGRDIFNKINKSKNYHNIIFADGNVYYFSQAKIEQYKVKVAINVDNLFELVLELTGAMIILNLIVIMVSIPLIRRFAKKWSYPLEKMDHQIKEIELNHAQNPQISVPTNPREVKNLARSFNSLLKIQTQALKREKEFVTDASHELKTPIAAIRGHVNLIKRRGEENPEIIKKSLPFLDSESKRIQILVNELLDLGRIQSVTTDLPTENLLPVVNEEVNTIEKESSRKIEVETSKKAEFPIVITDFKHLLYNLLENAAKYSPKDSPIFLKVLCEGNELLIQVKDKGQGIKAENKEKIFERFFREDKAHSSKIKGTGLGLAIVKAIVEKYHGKIQVADNKPTGTIFTIKFEK